MKKDGSWPKFSLQEGPMEELTSKTCPIKTQHSWPFFKLTFSSPWCIRQVSWYLLCIPWPSLIFWRSFLIQQTFLTWSSFTKCVCTHSQILLFFSSVNPHILPHTYPQWYSNNDIWTWIQCLLTVNHYDRHFKMHHLVKNLQTFLYCWY